MQLVHTAQFVQAQPGIHQPFERLAQVCFARQMRGPSFQRQVAFARVPQPRMDDLAVHLDLVQVVAAQTFIAEVCNPLSHELIRHFERLAGGWRLLVGLQRLTVPPPCQWIRHPVERRQIMRAMQFGGAARGGQSGARLAQRQVSLSDRSECIDFRRDAIGVVHAPERAFEVPQRCRGVAADHGKAALGQRHGAGSEWCGKVVLDRSHLIDVGARAVQPPHREFRVGERVQDIPQIGTCPHAPVSFVGLERQSAGAPIQSELAIGNAQVRRDDALALDVAGCFEIGERLIEQLQTGGEIRLVDREQVARIAHAVQVAGSLAQFQRVTGHFVSLAGTSQVAVRGGERPQGAPFTRSVAQCPKEFGSLGRILNGLFGQVFAPLRFGQVGEGHRRCRRLPALARGFQGGGGRRDCTLGIALPDLHQCLAVQRLRSKRQRLCGLGKTQHRRGIFACAAEVALRDVAFRAQVKEIESGGDAQTGRGQRNCGPFDGLDMLAGPRQVADLLGCGNRRFRLRRNSMAGQGLFRPGRRFPGFLPGWRGRHGSL